MTKIRLMRDPQYVPCCFIIARAPFDTRDEANTILVQSDWDYPFVAATFGGPFGDDAGENSLSRIQRAQSWLMEHIGAEAEDPGYFSQD